MLSFQDLPLALNLLIFTSAAVAIWLAGTRLSRYAEEIATRTGVGRALIGALLLGGITSLPEAATTTAAPAIGNAPLAVNNVFGGVAMQVAILGLADLIVPGRALSARIRQPAVLLQGVLLIGVLTLAGRKRHVTEPGAKEVPARVEGALLDLGVHSAPPACARARSRLRCSPTVPAIMTSAGDADMRMPRTDRWSRT